jgi:hypothetical protein
VNASHARPMLAFCLLAVLAALIITLGLGASAPRITVRSGEPSPVTRAGSPDLVLGGLLTARSTAGSTTSTAAALEYAANGPADAKTRAHTSATGTHPKSTTPAGTSVVEPAGATATPSGPGKSHQKHGRSEDIAKATATTTTTTTTTTTATQSTDDPSHGTAPLGSGRDTSR